MAARALRFAGREVYTNLAAEERLFRTLPSGSAMFYENGPAVVMGRTQNVLVEANVPAAKRRGYAIARRRSGGGCVAHGDGNLNVCLVRTSRMHDVTYGASILATVLRDEFGLPAECNNRGDVLLDDRKVSGSAHRVAKDRAYSHFTVLVDADLDALSEVLRAPGRERILARGTASVRAPVANVTEFLDVEMDDVVAAIAKHVAPEAHVTEIDPAKVDGVSVERDATACYNWVYGQTPRFSYGLEVVGGRFDIEVNKGCEVKSVKGTGGTAPTIVGREMNRALAGVPFDLDEIAPVAHGVVAKFLGTPLEPVARELTGNFLRDVPVHYWCSAKDSEDRQSITDKITRSCY